MPGPQPTGATCPRGRGRRLAGRLPGQPRKESEAGSPDRELPEGGACVQVTSGAFPQAWHRAALGQYLLTRTEWEAASQLSTSRPEGAGPPCSQPAASGGPPPTPRFADISKVGTAMPGVVRRGLGTETDQGMDTHRPNFPGPQHFPKDGINTTDPPVSRERWPVAQANISTEENITSARDF